MPKEAELKNLEKIRKKILKAIKEEKRIILYGDADLDGTCSVILLEETLQSFGFSKINVYFPDREKDGYGLQEESLKYLQKYLPAILILLDCGIGNIKEVELAKKMGFEVIIIDHHEILEKLPKADLILNPKQKNDKYPFKNFSNCGLCFKLVEKLFYKKFSQAIRKTFLELVALATIADMMPLEDENLELVQEGTQNIENSFRPGILSIFEIIQENNNFSNKFDLIKKSASILNISENEDHLTQTYLLLTEKNFEKSKKLAKIIFENAQKRYAQIEEITEELIQTIDPSARFIIVGSKDIPLVATGAIASRLCQRFKKPVFIFHQGKEFSRGSVRTPQGIDSVEILKKSSQFLLEGFGGHPPAAGFAIRNENLESWKKYLQDYFKSI
jgi:single-stranded-DNA-specific exonuclease